MDNWTSKPTQLHTSNFIRCTVCALTLVVDRAHRLNRLRDRTPRSEDNCLHPQVQGGARVVGGRLYAPLKRMDSVVRHS